MVLGDIHGSVEALERAKKYVEEKSPDAVLVCGDLTHLGGKKEAQRIIGNLATERIPVLYVDPAFQVEGVNAVCLHGKKTEFKDVELVGLSGNAWGYNFLSDIEKSDKPLIVVSHQPPQNILDKTWMGNHAGDPQIRKFIEIVQPDLMVCGHIHEAFGEAKLGRTVVCNVGKLGDGNIVTIDLKDQILIKRDKL
ncbi:MAG: metallophosphoesterase [Candidatus Jordarchaeaceae archaeon]